MIKSNITSEQQKNIKYITFNNSGLEESLELKAFEIDEREAEAINFLKEYYKEHKEEIEENLKKEQLKENQFFNYETGIKAPKELIIALMEKGHLSHLSNLYLRLRIKETKYNDKMETFIDNKYKEEANKHYTYIYDILEMIADLETKEAFLYSLSTIHLLNWYFLNKEQILNNTEKYRQLKIELDTLQKENEKAKTLEEKKEKIKLYNDKRKKMFDIILNKTFLSPTEYMRIKFYDINESLINAYKNKIESSEKNISLLNYEFDNSPYNIGFNDKVSNNITKFKENEEIEISKTTGNKKIDQKSNIIVKVSGKITPFQKVVYQTIFTITKEKNYFSVNEIVKRIKNKKNEVIDKETLKIKQKGNVKTQIDALVVEAIEILRKTDLSLIIAEEINNTFEKPLDENIQNNIKILGPMLPVYVIDRNINGNIIKSYEFIGNAKPLYFKYVEARGQLVYKPEEMLQIPNYRDDETGILIKDFICQKIQNLQYQLDNGKINKSLLNIKYETIFNELQLDISNRTTKSRYRERVLQVLEAQKEKGYIENYKENKDKKGSYTGFNLKLKKEKII